MNRLLLIFLLSLSSTGWANTGGVLSGRVVNAAGEPVANAQMRLLPLDVATFSDAGGRFSMSGIPAGRYTLQILHVGYQFRALDDIQVGRGERRLNTITLTESVVSISGTVVTATRSERQLNDVSQAANQVSALEIRRRNAKSTAEALREETGIFVQKTNHGGGSAIIRGLSSNQILILVDGIRLNNATYRLGNHQYLTTVDQNMLGGIEVVRGPTSVLHGSDALGGTINLITREPAFSDVPGRWQGSARLFGRYASADQERTGRAQAVAANDRLALMIGGSFKRFGDLRRGGNSDHPQLERATSGRVQRPTGFDARDSDAKLLYRPNDRQQVLAAFQYAEQLDVPRYDKYEDGSNVLWLYTPQRRSLAYVQYDHQVGRRLLSAMEVTLSYHRQEEGRRTQKRPDSIIEQERDDVRTLGFSLQGNSVMPAHLLVYGLDYYHDDIASNALEIDVASGLQTPAARGRYPDGARYRSIGIFVQDEWHVSDPLIATLGARYSYFNTEFTLPSDPGDPLSLGAQDLAFRSLTGSLGLIYKFSPAYSLSANLGQAFRAPNLSDLGKLGESKGETFEVPNTGLSPEKLLSGDLGLRIHDQRINGTLVGYYAAISDLLASADALYNGAATVVQDGDTLKVKAKENIGDAYITGVEAALQYQLGTTLSAYGNLTYAYGHNITADEPVGGVPPLFGVLGLRYRRGPMAARAYLRFAGAQKRLSADDKDDPRIPAGGTPGWQTWNVRAAWRLGGSVHLQAALENLLDVNYREHGSGVNGPGRNLIFSLELRR